MHREVGNEIVFPYGDRDWVGQVIAIKDPTTCLLQADGETFLERGQDITLLPESAACPHCGQYSFLCNEECPARQRKPKTKTKTMSKIKQVSEILAIEPGEKDGETVWVNGPFQAIVTDVKLSDGKGPNKAKLVQPSDPDIKINGIFWKVDPSDYEGKLCEFSGKGMRRTEFKPKQGKTMQQVEINDKTEIEVTGEAAHGSLPHPKGNDGRGGSDAPERPRMRNSATPVTARQVVYDCMRMLSLVNKAYLAMKESHNLPDLTPSDLKDIGTAVRIAISRGETLGPDVFGAEEEPSVGSFRDVANQPEQEWEADEAPAPAKAAGKASWKDFVHPKRGKRLGDIPEQDLLAFARYYAGEEPPDDKDGRLFYANVTMMMASKGWDDYAKLLTNSILMDNGYGEKFIDDDIEGYFKDEHGFALSQISNEDALNIIGDFDNVVDGIANYAAEKGSRKKAKGKPKMPD